MIDAFLDAYQSSRTRHIALLNDVKFLGQKQQDKILARERAVVDAYTEALEARLPQARAGRPTRAPSP